MARGPAGGTAAGIRGPGGAAAGAVRGPGGYGVAGARGPYGNRYVTNLPAGALHYPWHGADYWHTGYGWYQPYWVGDSMYYGWAYPPTGFYYPSLPEGYSTTVVNNTTYYESDGVYYQEGEQEGQKGYVVVEAPEVPGAATQEAAAPEQEAPNPFVYLKNMCDHLASLEKFSAAAEITSDELNEAGDRIQISGHRAIWVSRPDKCAFAATGDTGSRRVVYDGKTFSMLDLTRKVYTSVQVPDTLDAALDTLARDYGIVVPLEDLLYTDLYKRLEKRITAGEYLGVATLDPVQCHHLAFSTETADAELWIDAGDKPVLWKISIDYKGGGTRSRYSADFTAWKGSPTFDADTFAFKVPDGVKRIDIAPKPKEGSAQ